MEIVIYTEAKPETGLGHLTRCLSIYHAFLELKQIPLLVIHCHEVFLPFLKNINFVNKDWITDLNSLDWITNQSIVIIDSYLAPLSFYQFASAKAKKCVFFDDSIRLNYPEGLVVNGDIGAEHISYPVKNHVEYLLGIKYQVVRKEFWSILPKKTNIKLTKLLLSFGGNDFRNLASEILKFIATISTSYEINLITTSISSELQQTITNIKLPITMHLLPEANEIAELMYQADLAICSGGQTLYELAACRTPAIAIQVIDNQKNNIEEWAKTGFIRHAGTYDDIDLLDNIYSHLNDLSNYEIRCNCSEIARKVYSGEETLNLAKEILT